MLITVIPLLAAIVGLLLYAFASDKAQEVGRLTFLCGMLVTLAALAHQVVRL